MRRFARALLALLAAVAGLNAEASLTRSSSPAREAPALSLTLAAPEPSQFSLFDGTEIARALASRPAFDLISITTDDASAAVRTSFVSPSELSADELPSDAPELLPITNVREQRFNLRIPPDVFGLEPLRGPPGDEASYPRTRYRVFGLLGTPILGELRGVSLDLRWGCASFSCGLASGTVGWLSEDPLGDRDSPNLYGFVGGKPHMGTDPLGLESVQQAVDRYAEEAFAGDSVTKKLLAGGLIFLKAGFDVVSVGATKKIDKAQEQLDRGEITQAQYWKKTTVAVAQTAATYAGGAGVGALGARAGVRLLGSRGVTALGVRAAGAIGGASGGAGGQLAGDVVGIAAGEQEGLSSGETYLSATLIGGFIGAAGAIPARTPRDVAINPAPPAVRPLGRSIGRPSHNAALREEIERALSEGATDFRANQQQNTAGTTEAPGTRVGANRPDLQYTLGGRRVHFEFDAPPATRAVPHALRILANDPSAIVYLLTIP